jgi:hypothetical protein
MPSVIGGRNSKTSRASPHYARDAVARSLLKDHFLAARAKAHAFAALGAGKARKASSSANLHPFSLDLLSRLSRRRAYLRVAATMRLCRLDLPASRRRAVSSECAWFFRQIWWFHKKDGLGISLLTYWIFSRNKFLPTLASLVLYPRATPHSGEHKE